MRERYIKTIKSSAKQLLVVTFIVIGVGLWQTRDLPSGEAPQIVVSGLRGEHATLPDKASGKITLIYFFAPWCGICRVSINHLNRVQEFFPDINVRAVALDFESADEVSTFISDTKVSVPWFLGDDSVRDRWRVFAYPTYVVIGADQRVSAASIGYSPQIGMILRVLWTKIVS